MHPHQGFIQWHINEKSVADMEAELGSRAHCARMVLRIYNVTNIIFNGFNAHDFYDVEVNSRQGNFYVTVDTLGKNLMVEVGFRLADGEFRSFSRSIPVYFDRDHSSGNHQSSGLYVGADFDPLIRVANIYDANSFEQLEPEVVVHERKRIIHIASVSLSWNPGFNEVLKRIGDEMGELKIKKQYFLLPQDVKAPLENDDPFDFIKQQSDAIYAKLETAHSKKPFDMLHCHDWSAVPLCLKAHEQFGLPIVFFLHSTEHERSHGSELSEVSKEICRLEFEGVHAAQRIVVPRSSTHQQVVDIYRGSSELISIIEDGQEQVVLGSEVDRGETLSSVQLSPEKPMIFYCGEVSHASGADLLVDSLPHLCNEHGDIQFAIAGDGPLRWELEHRVNGAGLGHRVRFVGDVSQDMFEGLIGACDFVVIPARSWQDEGLAQFAIDAGKAVLITHQSHIKCIEHGKNGLITYDNPGSIVWGIKELIANPINQESYYKPKRHRQVDYSYIAKETVSVCEQV